MYMGVICRALILKTGCTLTWAIPVVKQLNITAEIMLLGTLSFVHCQLYVNISTVKILKFGTPQTIAIIVLKTEKFDVTLH